MAAEAQGGRFVGSHGSQSAGGRGAEIQKILR
jgi:hypothetical protein